MQITTILDKVKYFGLRKLYWIIRNILFSFSEMLIDNGLYLPRKQQALLKRPISRKLIEYYGGDHGHNLNFSQYFLGFGLIHYAIIRNIQPTNILCIGSRKGYIPAILALACKDNGFGHVDFVDAGYDEDLPSQHWSGIGYWNKVDPSKHFAKISVSNYISTYVQTSQEYAKNHSKKKYQYIYIDGDHSFKGVTSDYNLFWPRLDKSGFMSFHDIIAKGYLDKGLFGVWKLWKVLERKNAISFSFPSDSGLGILQKR